MTHTTTLKGMTVLVTGAGGGIGREVARMLADAGAAVALTDLQAEPLTEITREIEGAGRRVVSQPLDVTDRRAVGEWVRRAETELGPIAALVNVAGLWRPKAFLDVTDDDWMTMMQANLYSAFVCCQAVAREMMDRREGAIVNFASTAGEYGSISPAAHYAAAKGGVIAFTKSLARELGPYNVRVNAISPGPTDTVSLGADTEEKRVLVAQRTLLGRLGQPADIAAGVLYLVSPASAWVTGQVLRVNGGSLL